MSSFVAIAVEIVEFEDVFVWREVEVGEEECMVGDPAKCALGDFAFPVLGWACCDALVEHREGGFVLRGEYLFDVVEHLRSL